MAEFAKYLVRHYFLESKEDFDRANKALVYRIIKHYGPIDMDTLNRICFKVIPVRYFREGLFCTKSLVALLEQDGYVYTNVYGIIEFVKAA